MKTRVILLGSLTAAFLGAAAGPLPAAEATPPPNVLSPAEQAAGWRLLFDGQSTRGWRGYRRKDFPSQGWVVEAGCLRKLPRVRGGDIVTEAEFGDFELVWEWKLPASANNGVKYLVLESRPGAPGHEYQMIDDTTVNNPLQKTAAFYDVLPPGPNARPRPPGEWNTSRILVQGTHVEHWLNGQMVLAYELGSPEVKARVAASKFKKAPGFGEKCRGPILLTDHGDEAWFRNIKLRELPEAAAR